MNTTVLRNSVFALMTLSFLASGVRAEWPADPSMNLPIADRSGEQAQPKIKVTSDGGCYISWFDNSTGGYDVYLQRLDAQGEELWAHNGVLIADRGFSSTQDYALDVDDDDNALLAFRDDRFTDIQITAVKISPAGTALWGPTGVQLTNDNTFKAAPKIAATTDNAVVVGWTSETQIQFQRLSADGMPLWEDVLTLSDEEELSLSDLHGSDAGTVIASWIQTVSFPSPKHLYAQKLSVMGTEVWEARAIVFDGGSLQFGNFPPFVPDGSGGAVFAWYGVSPLQCYVQHIGADGSEQFAHDGVVASTLATQVRVSPSLGFDPSTAEIFLFWTELNSLQSQAGVYGQKFASDGTRQWGDSGIVVTPVDSAESNWVRTVQYADGALVFWIETIGLSDEPVFGARLDGSGNFVWKPSIIDVSTVASDKYRLATAQTPAGSALLAWMDNRTDTNDIYAQAVNTNGMLGPPACPGDTDGNGSVDINDLLELLATWGPCPGCPADINGDGTVDINDLLTLLANWGPC